MNNNTKLIMETWRRFLNEEVSGEDINRPFDFSKGEFVEEEMPEDGSEPQEDEPPFNSNVPVEADPDLTIPYNPDYEPGYHDSYAPDGENLDDEYEDDESSTEP